MLERSDYVQVLRDLLSRDPERVKSANRTLYLTTVVQCDGGAGTADNREADLVLAEVAGR